MRTGFLMPKSVLPQPAAPRGVAAPALPGPEAAVLGAVAEIIRRRLGFPEYQPGKALRARLALTCAEALGISEPDACLLAAAVEALHLASLLQDDVMDRSPARRGVPSYWCTAGAAAAILEADRLLVEVPLLLLAEGRDWHPVAELFLLASRATITGQLTEEHERAAPRDWTEFEACATRKTGAFLALPAPAALCRAGVLAPRAALAALTGWSHPAGTAYQLLNDWEDLCTGIRHNALPSDWQNRLINAPALVAADRLSSAQGRLLLNAITRGDAAQMQPFLLPDRYTFWGEDIGGDLEGRLTAFRSAAAHQLARLPRALQPALGAFMQQLALRPLMPPPCPIP